MRRLPRESSNVPRSRTRRGGRSMHRTYGASEADVRADRGVWPAVRARLNVAGRSSLRGLRDRRDRKSTRLNSSHLVISYAVFCLKKKKNDDTSYTTPRDVSVLT